MKKVFLFALVMGILIGCDDDESTPDSKLLMTFDPRFGGTEMQMGSTMESAEGYPFNTTAIKFYLSNIKLHSANGSTVVLSDIELVDLNANQRTLEFQIAPGSYSGISYDLGVSPNMNGTQDPDFSVAQYGPDHPLSVTNGMYWVWSSGYRFFTFEGRFNTDVNDHENLPMTYAFHTGTDTLYRELGTFQKNMTADNGNSILCAFAIEVDSIFSSSTGVIDLAVENTFHGSPDQMELGIKVADNMAKSFVWK